MISPLIPVAAAALGSLAVKAADRLGDSLSFARLLANPGGAADTSAPAGAERSSAVEATGPIEVTGVAVDASVQRSLRQLYDQLRPQLQAAGIDLSVPIRLRSDGLGGVRVDGDHPDRGRIERIIQDDPSLRLLLDHVFSRLGLDDVVVLSGNQIRVEPGELF